MSRTIKTEAIVLKKNNNLLNKDSLITLFTEKHGKITVIAKGIKKLTSRRLPHNQTGNLIKGIIIRRGSFFYLQETELISHFSEIKKQSKKLPWFYFYFFILDRLLPENDKELKIYNLSKKFLIQLAKKNSNLENLTFYLNKVLRLLGYIDKNLSFSEIKKTIEEIINQKLPTFII
ncbi:MAG: DNA repair protein RecO [Microgenomates group bacterium]|nr:DNA repair protein RecO [Microgenomates group bacterium]